MTTAIVCALYLAVLAALSMKGFRGTTGATDYLLGGRRTHQFVMAISYGATFISTAALVGFGGLAATTGLGLLWLTFLNVIVGVFIAFVFFGKRTHRLGLIYDAHTFPELLGKRFDSKLIQFAAGAMIFLFMPIYTAAVIKGGVHFIEVYFGIPYDVSLFIFVGIVAVYVMVGGFKAVMYTDFIQGVILLAAMAGLLVFAYYQLGGVISAHQQLTDLYVTLKNDPALETFTARGFVGWTAMPAFGSPLWWSLISSILGGVGFGVLAQPQLIVRFMTVKNTKDLNRAVLSGGIFILVTTGSAYVVGALSNAIIFKREGIIAYTAAQGVNDTIIPYFITNYLPEWYGALFLLTMLAAGMSTLSAQFHTMGAAAGRDIGGLLLPRHKDSLAINRYGMAVVILVSLTLAWLAKYIEAGEAVIAKGTIIFFEMGICAFLPVYLGALFLKKMPRKAAEAGLIAGFSAWFIWTFFLSATAKSLALCGIIFGRPTLLMGTSLEKFSVMGSSVIGLTVSVAAIAVIWRFAPGKNPAQ